MSEHDYKASIWYWWLITVLFIGAVTLAALAIFRQWG